MKIALESRELNKQVHKNKYQMPNIEELVDIIGQLISEKKQGEVYFTTMDLYRFRTGFYGLLSKPAEFQRVMDSILNKFPKRTRLLMIFWLQPRERK